jgi:hypothetical protein
MAVSRAVSAQGPADTRRTLFVFASSAIVFAIGNPMRIGLANRVG